MAVSGAGRRGGQYPEGEQSMSSAQTKASVGDTRDRREQGLRVALSLVHGGPILVLILLMIALTMLESRFLSVVNLQNVAVQSSIVAVLALGQVLVILTAGIDLSVGSVAALASVTGALAFAGGGAGVWVIPAMLATGLLVGLVNGVGYVKGRMPHPFIITLAMLNAARGLALLLADGRPIPGMPDFVVTMGSGFLGPVPVPALIVAVLAVLGVVLTRLMKWGRWIYAVGGDREAARRSGIPVDRVLISVYALSGLSAGVAGIILAGRTNSGYPTAGQLSELDAIAAVIIGGASFFGGRGRVSNVLIGALVLGVIRNGLNLLGVSSFWQLVIIGLVIAFAVELDVLRRHLENRYRTMEGERA